MFNKLGAYFNIFTHLTVGERLMLYKLARSLPKNSIIVELGSYLGASSCFLAEGANKNDSTLYCVDTWLNDGMTEGKRDTFSEWRANTKHFTNIIPLRGYNNKIVKEFNERIDLLFIDSDHSYEAIKEDIKNWLPKLRSKGIIAIHDIEWSEDIRKAIWAFVMPRIQHIKLLPNLFVGYMYDRP